MARREIARYAKLRIEYQVITAFLARVEARCNRPSDRTTGKPPTFEPPAAVPGGDAYQRCVNAELQAMKAELEGKGGDA